MGSTDFGLIALGTMTVVVRRATLGSRETMAKASTEVPWTLRRRLFLRAFEVSSRGRTSDGLPD
jgi:hypothetical protein